MGTNNWGQERPNFLWARARGLGWGYTYNLDSGIFLYLSSM